MAFTFDETLADPLSRARALLLDTVESKPLFSDEAITNYFTLFGVNEGTANLAVILMNRYGNMPSEATIAGLGGATWRSRQLAWESVIANARGGSVLGGPTAFLDSFQVEVVHDDNPYVLRNRHGDILTKEQLRRRVWRRGYYPW